MQLYIGQTFGTIIQTSIETESPRWIDIDQRTRGQESGISLTKGTRAFGHCIIHTDKRLINKRYSVSGSFMFCGDANCDVSSYGAPRHRKLARHT